MNNIQNYYYYYGVSFDRQSIGPKQGPFCIAKKQIPFRMAIGNVELMQEDFPKHMPMGTARMK